MTRAKSDAKSSVVVPVMATSKSGDQLPPQDTLGRQDPGNAIPSATTEQTSLSLLNIARNKHWRFISSFHGPWLQLPHELLESLALGNYFSARPNLIDAGVFFDVVRIRRLVDEATNLSVRAVNGTSSSALSTSLNAGLGQRRGGGTIKLSGERRYRMRELAVKKLSEAYHLDEVAASVATMQSASSLEDVAKMVLQRSPSEAHAKYVHFFHEKIPSRALAESTSLQSLNDILQETPTDCAVLRTRAVTRIFKEDYIGAAKDLTEALNCFRRDAPQHLVSTDLNGSDGEISISNGKLWESRHASQKLSDDAKPTGLEAQLCFQRASVYLSAACQSVGKALQPTCNGNNGLNGPQNNGSGSHESLEAYRKVKLNAKRALRDFTAFLSKLEYTPGLPEPGSNASLIGLAKVGPLRTEGNDVQSPVFEETGADTITRTSSVNSVTNEKNFSATSIKVYKVSDLFSPTPPVNLPPFPATNMSLVKIESKDGPREDRSAGTPERYEIVSYHPLLMEALHGVLLCHALLQTDKAQIKKHAFMAARLVALSDCFPIFVAARSASRADWVDILDQNPSWLEFGTPWDHLCKTINPSKQARMQKRRTEKQSKDSTKNDTAMEGFIEDRSPTNQALHAAADAMQTQPEQVKNEVFEQKAKARVDLKAYSLGTERADIIARWIMEAPELPEAPAKPKKGKKKTARGSPLAH